MTNDEEFVEQDDTTEDEETTDDIDWFGEPSGYW